MVFKSNDFYCTWWRLFLLYLMKIIFIVPDEGYFYCTWWRLFLLHTWWRLFLLYLMKVIFIVPDEGYFYCVPDEGYLYCTWWRLFLSYLMKVIFIVPDEGYSRKVSCSLDNCVFINKQWLQPLQLKLLAEETKVFTKLLQYIKTWFNNVLFYRQFGDVMCKSACPVSRRRRYASNVKQDWVKFEKEEKLVSFSMTK